MANSWANFNICTYHNYTCRSILILHNIISETHVVDCISSDWNFAIQYHNDRYSFSILHVY